MWSWLWVRFVALARSIAIIAFSIFVGVGVALALRLAHVEDNAQQLLKTLNLDAFGKEIFGNIDGLVADLVAGSFATGLTLYLSVYVIQIREMRREIKTAFQTGLLGIESFDPRRAIALERLEPTPAFSVGHPIFPMLICNTKTVFDKQFANIDPEKIKQVALAIELFAECSGELLLEGFKSLRTQYSTVFEFVLLVERAGSGYIIRGIARADDFFQLINPSFDHYDANVCNALAKLASLPDPVVFEAMGFVVGAIPLGSDVGVMMRDLVKAQRNTALVADGHSVIGIAELWRLAKVALAMVST